MLRGVRPELYRATATRHGPPVSGWRLRWSVDVLLATGLWFDRSSLAELFHPAGKAARQGRTAVTEVATDARGRPDRHRPGCEPHSRRIESCVRTAPTYPERMSRPRSGPTAFGP